MSKGESYVGILRAEILKAHVGFLRGTNDP
jgi:hypothetical protein